MAKLLYVETRDHIIEAEHGLLSRRHLDSLMLFLLVYTFQTYQGSVSVKM